MTSERFSIHPQITRGQGPSHTFAMQHIAHDDSSSPTQGATGRAGRNNVHKTGWVKRVSTGWLLSDIATVGEGFKSPGPLLAVVP